MSQNEGLPESINEAEHPTYIMVAAMRNKLGRPVAQDDSVMQDCYLLMNKQEAIVLASELQIARAFTAEDRADPKRMVDKVQPSCKTGDVIFDMVIVVDKHCEEALLRIQSGNPKKQAHWISYRDGRASAATWAKRFGINPSTFRQRLNKLGWPMERALLKHG